jgi:chromosome segregation ATPase
MTKKKKVPATEESSSGLEGLEMKFALLQCKSATQTLESYAARMGAAQEALKRARIEVQTLPGNIEQMKAQYDDHRQKAQTLYDALKEKLKCPEGKEIDLDTGEFTDPPSRSQ